MGHEIEAVAIERGHKVVLIVDKDNADDLNPTNLSKVDVAVEFTSPQTAFQNVTICLNAGTPVVCGTTGWNDKLKEVIAATKSGNNGTFFYASNYSVGMNIFFKINSIAAKLFSRVSGYGVSVKEIHHTQKKDAPSGTAITIAEGIAKEIDGLNGWTLLPEREVDKIPIEASRIGNVPGIHDVTYSSQMDTILLSHQAVSRRGFALGAVMAAEFVVGKSGFFNMDNLLQMDSM